MCKKQFQEKKMHEKEQTVFFFSHTKEQISTEWNFIIFSIIFSFNFGFTHEETKFS